MRAYLAVCVLIVAFLLAAGASQVSGTPIVVTSKGQLVSNPGPTGAAAIPFLVLLITVPVFWASFVVRQVLSWRRSTGERRAQLKWLMTGGSATVGGLGGTFLFAQFSGLLASVLGNLMLGVGIFSLPVGIVFAILKYHLYDIDRLISRTLSYTLVTGLFNPMRRRVQRMVDRRFNRARYDADRIVAAFASRLKDEVDLDSISGDLAGAVYRALEPAQISVWLYPEVDRPASSR